MKLLRITLLSALALASAGLGIWLADKTLDKTEPTGYPRLGGNFTLQSASGPVSLSDLKGKVVPIYFGYASCPDICPTTLASLGQAMKQLSAEELAQVQALFISVDPDRDTPESLAEYAGYFHPQIMGLTGDKTSIDNITRRYGVIYAKVDMEGSSLGYAVDHSSILFIIGKDGVVKKLIRHQDESVNLADSLREVIAE